MPRPKNTDTRRSEITEAMIGVMAARGYDGASIAQVAKAAGLTTGLVLYHFKKKQDILLAALELIAARQEEALDAALKPKRKALTRLDAFIDVHLATGAQARPEDLGCWVMLCGEALRQEEVREGFDAATTGLLHRLQGIVDAGIAKGEFSPRGTDSASIAAAITATIQGYFLLAATARHLVPPGSAARHTKLMARALLGIAP